MLVRMMNFLSIWVIPLVVVSVILFALYRRVNVFEVFVEGAKEGFQMAVHLIPYLVGMMVAIGLFKDSGAMDLIIRQLHAIDRSSHPPRYCPGHDASNVRQRPWPSLPKYCTTAGRIHCWENCFYHAGQ